MLCLRIFCHTLCETLFSGTSCLLLYVRVRSPLYACYVDRWPDDIPHLGSILWRRNIRFYRSRAAGWRGTRLVYVWMGGLGVVERRGEAREGGKNVGFRAEMFWIPRCGTVGYIISDSEEGRVQWVEVA